MNIIKHGSTFKRYKCGHCDCIFEISDKEAKSNKYISRCRINCVDKIVAYCISCPECGKSVPIEREKSWDDASEKELIKKYGDGCFEVECNSSKKL